VSEWIAIINEDIVVTGDTGPAAYTRKDTSERSHIDLCFNPAF